MTGPRPDDPAGGAAAARLRWFKIHMAAYVAAMAVLVLVNLFWLTGRPWFVVFMVGWGAPLALHCAYAMGLFGRGRS